MIRYDFNAITADVLGAVYEQYLGFKSLDPHAQIDTAKSKKRKSQGIYYTPQYVVRYIVSQTVGKLLQDGRDPYTLRILDPACGSGSFLIEAFDVLDRWHNQHNPNATPADRQKWRRHILTENLYGVDLDDQAVEVTRLNLMLRAALERKKLPYLTHIQHGNSLIDDDAIAGSGLGFDWTRRFESVMDAGGFDAVIGNPPYGAKLNAAQRPYLTQKFKIGSSDTAALMMMLAYQLLKSDGYNGFIVPKAFAFASNWEPLRAAFLADLRVLLDVNKAWKEVQLEQIVYILQKNNPQLTYESLQRAEEKFVQLATIPKTYAQEFGFYVNGLTQKELNLGQKIVLCSVRLGTFTQNSRGGMLQSLIDPALKQGQRVIGGKQVQPWCIEGTKGYLGSDTAVSINARVKVGSILAQNIIAHIANPIDHIKIIATVATEQDQDLVILDTVNQLTHQSDLSSYYLLALLHSKLLNWWVYRFIFAKAIRTMHFDTPVSDRIPIRKLDLTDPSQKAQHDHIVTLVDRLLKLKQEHAHHSDLLSDRRHELLEEITRVDGKIDAAVYALYGLDPDEIALIEGI
ncbi:MAG: SAM-dependent methyltransferase [Anaerolineae bacterium]|nr:SAM-dependent methyltransferase [Anaerolineae bacterium]